MLSYDADTRKLQNEYTNLILSHQDKFSDPSKYSLEDVSYFIDMIDLFWRENLDLIECIFDRLTRTKSVYLLSGAMYLGINTNEHYLFKAVGDIQCVDCPIMKMDLFVRNNYDVFGGSSIKEFFSRSFNDTVDALSNYKDDFMFVPSQLMVWDSENHMQETIAEWTSNILINLFVDEIEDLHDYLDKFDTINDIEKALIPGTLDYMIFTDPDDLKLTLEERCNRYLNDHGVFKMLNDQTISPSMQFMFPLQAMIGQSIDIILKSLVLNVTPFIRQNATFHNFMLIMHSIKEDEIKKMLCKSTICYVLYKTYDNDMLSQYDYNEYKNLIMELDLVDTTYQEVVDSFIEEKMSLKSITNIIIPMFDNQILNKLTPKEK